jgi:DNA-binding FadR family transcriptional regulator
MESHRDDLQAWSGADLEFHRAIAGATHNPLVRSIIDALIDPLLVVIAAGYADPQGTHAGLEAHTRITTAIHNHDSQAAHQAMLDHLTDSEQRLRKNQ